MCVWRTHVRTRTHFLVQVVAEPSVCACSSQPLCRTLSASCSRSCQGCRSGSSGKHASLPPRFGSLAPPSPVPAASISSAYTVGATIRPAESPPTRYVQGDSGLRMLASQPAFGRTRLLGWRPILYYIRAWRGGGCFFSCETLRCSPSYSLASVYGVRRFMASANRCTDVHAVDCSCWLQPVQVTHTRGRGAAQAGLYKQEPNGEYWLLPKPSPPKPAVASCPFRP